MATQSLAQTTKGPNSGKSIIEFITPTEADVERFWALVSKGPGPDDCWLIGRRNTYAKFYIQGCVVSAHRFAFEIYFGLIPEGKVLHHRPTCPRNCIRPDHLTPMSHAENLHEDKP